jgi:hypothetical protein
MDTRQDSTYDRAASVFQRMPLVLHDGIPEIGADRPSTERASEELLDGDLGDPRGREEFRAAGHTPREVAQHTAHGESR